MMKRAGRMIVGLMVCATAFHAFGQSVPEGFRDLKWGATLEQVSREFPYADCKTQQTERSDWACTTRDEKVNGVSVFLTFEGFTTGVVVGFSIFSLSFPSDEVRHIVDAFESRYGPPTRIEEEEFLTKGGARFPNAIWKWYFPKSTIIIKQHAHQLGLAAAQVFLYAVEEELQQRTQQRKRGAGKGL